MKQLVWIFCILYAGSAHGQNSLKIGDRLPDLPMAKVLYKDKIVSVNSSDYKDKLLIIDFWSTSCSYCIETFPKLDELQKTYANKIKIISATYHTAEEVRKFKSINKIAREFRLPIMVEDSLFKSYFPYVALPHVAWINKGVVIGITSADYVHPIIINKILNGEKVHLPLKYDFYAFDFKNQSILGKVQDKKVKRYFAVTGYLPEVPFDVTGKTVKDSLNGTIKEVSLNGEIITLYKRLLSRLQPDSILSNRNIINGTSNPERYEFNKNNKDEFFTDWKEKNAICYEAVFPLNTDEKTRAKMIMSDLDNKLGLQFRLEKRPMKTLVISTLKDEQLKSTSDSKIIPSDKQSLKALMLILQINATYGVYSDLPPVIDEVNQPDKILQLFAYKDFPSLKKLLNFNGLDVSEQIRNVSVFVLTDKP